MRLRGIQREKFIHFGWPALACLLSLPFLVGGCGLTHAAAPSSAAAHAAATPTTTPATNVPPAGPQVVTLAMGQLTRHIRISGQTEAAQSLTVRVPHFPHSGGDQILTYIAPTGTVVHKGDVVARFDNTVELQNEQAALAQYDDLSHQVDDKKAQNRSNSEQRAAALQAAEAALGKAQLELRKAPILSEIDADTDRVNVADAKAQIASLKISNADQDRADAAALKILELQRDQQNQELLRSQTAVRDLTLRAPIAGMVALISSFHNGSYTPPQEGDQLWGRSPLLRIFDPTRMLVEANISEADGALLSAGLPAEITLDAYPKARFAAQFVSISPVATAPRDSPVRSFTAVFSLEKSDPRLLPDLSAAVDLDARTGAPRLLAPRGAVYFRQGVAYVTAVAPDGSRRPQRVDLGEFDAQNIAITGGLAPGARVLANATGAGVSAAASPGAGS